MALNPQNQSGMRPFVGSWDGETCSLNSFALPYQAGYNATNPGLAWFPIIGMQRASVNHYDL